MGFDSLDDDVFKQLLLARAIEPVSKLDTIRVLSGMGLDAPSYSRINRTLERVVREGYRDALSETCFRNAFLRGSTVDAGSSSHTCRQKRRL